MPRQRIETRGRARALQALYAWDMRGARGLGRIAAQLWDDLAVGAEEREIASRLVNVLEQHRAALDAELERVTDNWRLERLAALDRAVLRLGAAELHAGETPPRVVIQECVRLAERYSSERSARFVNGVLDALARRMGRL
jgi:N utilization substance protein B